MPICEFTAWRRTRGEHDDLAVGLRGPLRLPKSWCQNEVAVGALRPAAAKVFSSSTSSRMKTRPA